MCYTDSPWLRLLDPTQVYPGCACDVPSNLYSLSFAPNPEWKFFFGRQPEIRAYLESIATRYGVRPYIKFNTTVERVDWDEQRQIWAITAKGSSQKMYTQFIINGQGGLSNPQLPKIKGIDSYKGRMMHSAVWDNSYDFKNKKIAVVGTGASSIQLVPELAKVEGLEMVILQRTAPWIVPRLDRKVTSVEKVLFRMFPFLQQGMRALVYWAREIMVLNFVYRWPTRWINIQLVNFFVKQQIDTKKHPDLLRKILPQWELGCKRVLLSNDWYPTLQQPNVTLEDDAIDEVKEHSIVTKGGKEYEVDCIVWSTGFQVQPQGQRLPIAVYGKNGLLLDDYWSESVQAYKGICIPEFPNIFLMLGPNTGLAHNSIIFMLESQCQYIVEALKYAERNKKAVLEVKAESSKEWNAGIQKRLKKSVWQTGGCKSWYLDKAGNNTTLYPGFTFSYRLETQDFDADKFKTVGYSNRVAGLVENGKSK